METAMPETITTSCQMCRTGMSISGCNQRRKWLGFFVSGHPLDKYADKIKNVRALDTATALEMKPSPPPTRRGQQQPENDVTIAGVIVGLKVAKSKRSGELYAQASLEDTVGKIDLICFPKDYAKLAEVLKIEVPVLVKGQLACRRRCSEQAVRFVDPGARRCARASCQAMCASR